ncbi:hypothetical protein PRK78_005864 [Emydomyces testavorans]|uniref:Uncharacterized protein n=1 Tax=Emydomyces testavorans TaxID=2070801 RepID=A0AAF0DLC2_9EURO|nr:hypothetical protein PRK78_005864 [Emydomyces testavorans]
MAIGHQKRRLERGKKHENPVYVGRIPASVDKEVARTELGKITNDTGNSEVQWKRLHQVEGKRAAKGYGQNAGHE